MPLYYIKTYPTDFLSEDFEDNNDFVSTCSVSYIAPLNHNEDSYIYVCSSN